MKQLSMTKRVEHFFFSLIFLCRSSTATSPPKSPSALSFRLGEEDKSTLVNRVQSQGGSNNSIKLPADLNHSARRRSISTGLRIVHDHMWLISYYYQQPLRFMQNNWPLRSLCYFHLSKPMAWHLPQMLLEGRHRYAGSRKDEQSVVKRRGQLEESDVDAHSGSVQSEF